MANFSATDCAFAGFRLMRERPKVILAWAVFLLLASLLSSAILIAFGAGQAMADLQALQASDNEDPAVVMHALSQLGPLLAVLPVLNLGIYAVLLAAANRAFLRPGDKALGAFRFGRDELRVAGLMILMFLVWLGYLVAVAFLGTLIVTIAQFLGGTLAALLEIILIVGSFAGVLYGWVRLSLALPMTVDQGEIILFRSWKLTHGHFWHLFGAYLLTAVVLVVVALLMFIVSVGLLAATAALMGGRIGDLPRMMQPNATSFAAYFTPGVFLFVVLNALISAALLAIWAGPPAEAYLELSPADRDEAFE